MDRRALYTDCTSHYVIPSEPKAYEKIVIRFRTAKDDVDYVKLMSNQEEFEMELEKQTELFDYYRTEVQLGTKMFVYRFEVRKGDEVCHYHRFGIIENLQAAYPFEVMPGFSTPQWAKGAVMYQIFVDRFFNGDKTNDVANNEYHYIGDKAVRVTDWDKPPAMMGIREFYGGDLQGVMDKLDYLQDLGVEVIYLNPIFVSPSNHKYDIQDYDYVDPHYGKIVKDGGRVLDPNEMSNENATKYQIRTTDKANLEASNQLFAELVEEIHRRGMRIILDGVFNHCGSFNKWMDRERIYENQEGYEKGAYVSKDSPYRKFFRFHEDYDEKWPYNGSYDGWWSHDTLPKMNFEGSEELEEYILEIGQKWVSPPYNVDGWRLDVAADLGHSNEYNHGFWEKFRKVVKAANPEAIILAEHYGDPKEWLRGDEWDTIMNYDAFMEPVTWFLTGMEKHSDERREDLEGNGECFVYTMAHHMSDMLNPSLAVAMNELSNHDHSRFLTRTNHMVGRVEQLGSKAASQYIVPAVMREAVVIQMTWVGAPTIYYGDEVGVCGFTDPDNRRTYPWGNENKELLDFHKKMIAVRRDNPVLKTGCFHALTWDQDMLAYARFTEEDQIIVVINHGDKHRVVEVPVRNAEVPLNAKMERLMYTYRDGFTTMEDQYHVKNGVLHLNMGASSALVMRTKK